MFFAGAPPVKVTAAPADCLVRNLNDEDINASCASAGTSALEGDGSAHVDIRAKGADAGCQRIVCAAKVATQASSTEIDPGIVGIGVRGGSLSAQSQSMKGMLSKDFVSSLA